MSKDSHKSKPISLEGIRTSPLGERKSKVSLADIGQT